MIKELFVVLFIIFQKERAVLKKNKNFKRLKGESFMTSDIKRSYYPVYSRFTDSSIGKFFVFTNYFKLVMVL